jgi:hypothetical protein
MAHAHRRTHARHTQHGPRSAHPTHRPQKIPTSHIRGLRATLTAEPSGCPASTGCCRRVGCCSSTTPCRTQPSRHTMAPDADADPSQPPATHLSAHRIASIKSKPVTCYRSRAATGVRLSQTTPPDSRQAPSSHSTSQRHTATVAQVTTRRQRRHAGANKRSAHRNPNKATTNSE